MRNDYYLVLRVEPQATLEQIRAAYRRRALELHPDRSGADSEPFLELQQAYEVLSDPDRRAVYDQRARASSRQGRIRRRAHPARTAEPFREIIPAEGFRDISLRESFDTFHPSFDELFDRLSGNFSSLSRPKGERLETLNVEVPLSNAEAWEGGTVNLTVPVSTSCPSCHGRGAVGWYECWRCRGQGTLAIEHPVSVGYPAGLRRDYVVRVSLEQLGIHNLFLTVRFRPSAAEALG